jgi:hypothetical protein
LTVLLLFAVGIYASAPFLRGTYVGTGEAYNYSLSLADAVTQARSGVFPVLVGQTEFAFNGRIHPLRTAPWYCCAACLLDFTTFHGLNFWQLQDTILTLSIVGAGFSAYGAMRFLAGAGRWVALVGAFLFVLSPGVISTAYAMDLYMTVTALPFVPLVAASNIASFSRRSFGVYLVLGASIGFLWLAHPPIALWLSSATAFIQFIVWVTRKPTLADVASVLPGLAVCFLLAGYSFVSTAAMHDVGGLSRPEDYSPLFTELSKAFPSCLLPVSAEARQLSDFQLGYVDWALLLVGAVLAIRGRRLGPAMLLACAVFALLLTLPVPRLTKAIWLHLPPVYPNLTNIWPMQRLYLVATGLIFGAAGAIWSDAEARLRSLPKGRRAIVAVLCGLLLWQGAQARPFIKRGDLLQHGGDESADLHRSENVDLTVTSYALLGVPPRYVNGVMDAGREFRILRHSDQSELSNNWSPVTGGRLRAHGVLHTTTLNLEPSPLSPEMRIEPYKRYFLTMKFRSAPFNGVLVLTGEHFRREYPLPSAGERRGFGMNPGNDSSLELWTTDPDGTQIQLALVGFRRNGAFAEFDLREVDPARFPVELEGFVPLSGRVRSQEVAWLETPRRFIPGYAASIDGKPARVSESPDGSVMVEVPAGDHAFQVSYKGTWKLVAGFWVSFCTAAALGIATLGYPASLAWGQFRSRKSADGPITPVARAPV